MRSFARSSVLALVGALTACAPSGESLDALVADAEQHGFSGVVLVVRGGEVLVHAGGGEAIRGEQPFTTDTVSSIGSLTKQFTAAAVLAAEEDGLLSVEDRVSDHLEGVPPDKAALTIDALLTHRAGFAESLGADEDPITRDAWLAEVWSTPLEHSPGEFHYSNVGYGVAAAVIEAATGEDYESWLRGRLLLPLGMERTGYDDPDWSGAVIAHGYRRACVYGEPLGVAGIDDRWRVVGNGELLSTASDMRLWVEGLAAGEVLSTEFVERLWTAHADNDGLGYGYGWGVEEDAAHGRIVEHDGSNDYYYAHLAWWRDADLLVFFMANDYRGWLTSYVWDLSRAALAEPT